MSHHLLVIEDEAQLRDGLRMNFEFEGYRVSAAEDGVTGLELALSLVPDLIILDIMLPRMNGYDICRRIRRAGLDVPVLLLTVKREEGERVLGFEVGADDYVLKPFSVRELSARVKALLRRSGARRAETHVLSLSGVEIDLERQVVLRKGKPVRLSFREFEVLRCLAARMGEVVTRDELLAEALGYSPLASSRAVDNLVVGLRKKLETNYHNPRHILTAYGIGYKLVP
ncbi:MAG TPA: response regulator transcription factor [Vicinamibacteria bacterium]|nr:response regulator transcription factor [Vicinamibacteria bacterium]